MSTACDHCINAQYCEQRAKCDFVDGCYDFVEAVHD